MFVHAGMCVCVYVFVCVCVRAADKTSACYMQAPCLNGGVCRYMSSAGDSLSEYQCRCQDGFAGEFCQQGE